MTKNIKKISYTFATLCAVVAVSVPVNAAGVTSGVSSITGTTSSIEMASSSTFAGVSLQMNNLLANATVAAAEVSKNETEDVALAPDEYANVAIAQVNNYVYIRSEASADSEYVGKLYNNSAATVHETVEAEDGEWLQITSGDCTGYVKSEFVIQGDEELAKKVSRRVATITGETVYVREEPNTDCSIIDSLPLADELTAIDEELLDQGWVKVTCDAGEGYVCADYVTLSTEYTVAESKAAEQARLAKEEADRKAAQAAAAKKAKKSGKGSDALPAATGSGASSVVSYGAQFVGNPYVYGGSSLTGGTDCSGFVMSVYGAFGVSLPHSSSAMRSCGYGVSYDQMLPGDIVCYSGHVGIYAGNGQLLHASNKRTGITYSNVNYRPIVAIRRIF